MPYKTHKMKNIIILFFSVAMVACNRNIIPSNTIVANQQKINTELKDTVLIGQCSKSVLLQNPYSNWFTKNYNAYKVDTPTATLLQPLLTNKTMEIFLGSWCGDTKREVPRILKILEVANMDTANIKLIFVNHTNEEYKMSNKGEENGKNIHHVPTFILYDDKKEIGRIVETPLESFEKDLITIISKTPYTPKYKALEQWQAKTKNIHSSIDEDALQNFAKQLKPLTRHSGEFNAYGYVLLAQKKYAGAINVFKLNCLLYPNNTGILDSLAEGYYYSGDLTKAKEVYQKILDLKPNDEQAKKMLEKIK